LLNITPEVDEYGHNGVFSQLLAFYECHTQPTYQPWDAWIAPDMWALIDKCTVALHRLAPQNELHPLCKAIQKKIKRDQAACLQATGEEIQGHLDMDNLQEAWWLIKLWYHHHSQAVLPTLADLRTIKQDFRTLYM